MKAIWLWVLAPTAILFYLAFQLASVSSRMTTLEDRIARMELRWATEDEPGPAQPPAAPDSGSLQAPAVWSVPSRPSAPGKPLDLSELRNELQALKAQLGPSTDRRILQIIEREQDEAVSRHLQFEREKWIAARDQGLQSLTVNAQLSPEQREQIKILMDREVDRVVELMRDREVRENPERLTSAWDEVLINTDYEVRSVLSDWQQDRWEEARAFERAVFLPFLPH